MKTVAIGHFDKTLTTKIQNLPTEIKPTMNAATLCGNTLPVFIILSLQFILASPSTKIAIIFIATVIILNVALKQFIHRPRPETIYVSLMRFKTHSFPSGHAFGSITAYGFLAYQTIQYLLIPWNVAAVIFIASLIAIIGLSRVYLGAHYPTDVVGGWLLGAICLSVAIAIV
jgi:undecaprenyl-diphosphatase